MKKRIVIVGGGPAALFILQGLASSNRRDVSIDVFERSKHPGMGLAYSAKGANKEHVTNVSGNEIPDLEASLRSWVENLPAEAVSPFNIKPHHFSDYRVLPRLLFGQYLENQFDKVVDRLHENGIEINIHLGCEITDVVDVPDSNEVKIRVANSESLVFDQAILCIGHHFPRIKEGIVPEYFDSPYPPSKFTETYNHSVGLLGSSLTAIDAIRTLARKHGRFRRRGKDELVYEPDPAFPEFRIEMYSRHGYLPGIRFHLDDPHLSKKGLLTKNDIQHHRADNHGFVSLDYIFEKDFKEMFRQQDPAFYDGIREMNLEEFVSAMMNEHAGKDPFNFFRAEYADAAESIRRHESVYWKEKLAILSFAMNYPAKYLSAEDMLRLQHVLMPLISIVIAFVPQESCEELMALHTTGRLSLTAIGEQGAVHINEEDSIEVQFPDEGRKMQRRIFKTFIDCTGQRHFMIDDFPFPSLVKQGAVSAASLAFRDAGVARDLLKDGNQKILQHENATFQLQVPGLAITDGFRIVNRDGEGNPRIYLMAVPYISGFNPDYSGLDFCEEAAQAIIADMAEKIPA